MRPDGKDYSLYYAHLDSQLVNSGQNVRIGDTLGLVGNTGNARYTPSHLHFGIYTGAGTVDPIHFVDKDIKMPAQVAAPLNLLNATARVKRDAKILIAPLATSKSITMLPANTPLTINAATSIFYKVTLPDGRVGYIENKLVESVSPLRKLVSKSKTLLFNSPDTSNAVPVAAANLGDKLEVLGTYKSYVLVRVGDNSGWMPLQR